MHWIVYHSVSTIGYEYKTLGRSIAYSKRNRSKLAFRDTIWVIQGPEKFSLVDCFTVEDFEYGPFSGDFKEFKFAVTGESKLISTVNLDKSNHPWFEDVRSKHLSKQDFFFTVDGREVIDGLNNLLIGA